MIPNFRLNQTIDFKGETSVGYINISEADETLKNHLYHLEIKMV
jgi:hypothetical protein